MLKTSISQFALSFRCALENDMAKLSIDDECFTESNIINFSEAYIWR